MALNTQDKALSAQQQANIQSATDAWNRANTAGDKSGMAAAHAMAEAVRNGAGYTSDSSGGYAGEVGAPIKPASPTGEMPIITPAGRPPQTTKPGINQPALPARTAGGVDYTSIYDQKNMTPEELSALAGYKQAYADAEAAGDRTAMDSAHGAAEALRSKYQYSGGTYGNEFLSSQQPTQGGVPDLSANLDRVGHVDPSGLEGILAQIVAAQKTQTDSQIDFATQQSVVELERAKQNAAAKFQTERNQVTADEMNALDNQALYSETRGDRGGIGKAQYGAIQNTAAQNRLSVNAEQTKLANDTARQISDLRAKGEFEKADKVLEITQTYLSNLMNLGQWALEANLGVDEFNAQLQQWESEYKLNVQQYLDNAELSKAQLTGQFSDGTTTIDAQETLNGRLAGTGKTMLEMGMMPSSEQLKAMGMGQEQAQAYLNALALKSAASDAGQGGGSDTGSILQKMRAAGIRTETEAKDWLLSNGYKTEAYLDLAYEYEAWLNTQTKTQSSDDTSGKSADLYRIQWRLSHAMTPVYAQKEEATGLYSSGQITAEQYEAVMHELGAQGKSQSS